MKNTTAENSVPKRAISKKVPVVTVKVTDYMHASITYIEHILDVDSNDLGLKMAKSEKVRFYELSYGKNNSIQVSYAVKVEKKIEDRLYLQRTKKGMQITWKSVKLT